MKKALLFTTVLIAASTFCSAQDTITHNNSQIVLPGVALTCQFSGVTQDNSYYSVFDLANDFSITGDWQITSVECGIEDADNLLNGVFPLYVAAYTTDDNTPGGNLVLLGSDTLHVTNADELTVASVQFPPNVIAPAGSVVVIEIRATGDGQSDFRIGATNIASNDDSWGYTPPCGIMVPSTHASTGFPNVHNIINMVGNDANIGLNESFLASVKVYPNPTTGPVNIEIPEGIEVRNAKLFDMVGNEFEAPFMNNRIDISAYANGFYILTIETSNGFLRKRIVKK